MKRCIQMLVLLVAVVFVYDGDSIDMHVYTNQEIEESVSSTDVADAMSLNKTTTSSIVASVKTTRSSLKKTAEYVAIRVIISFTTVPFILLATSLHIGAIGGHEVLKELIQEHLHSQSVFRTAT